MMLLLGVFLVALGIVRLDNEMWIRGGVDLVVGAVCLLSVKTR